MIFTSSKFNFLTIFLFLLQICFIASLKVDPTSSLFIDQYNRSLIYHGVNVVFKTFPFYPDTEKFSSNYSLTDMDLYNLKHWGMNTIRLHVAWEGVEPKKGQYNYTYVEKLKQIVRKCNRFGISVILDAHQDLFTKKFCGQGFPDWTANRTNFPYPLKVKLRYDQNGYPIRQDCLKIPFSEFYLSQDVNKLQEDFFTDKRNLLTYFAKMWQIVASYMQDEPNIIGYELINEPIGANGYKNVANAVQPGVSNNKFLLPAYKKIYKAIRQVDTKTIIFFEPSVIDALSEGFFQTPGGENELSKQVFSYHVYCPLVTQQGQPIITGACRIWDQLEVESKQLNIKKMKIGGFMTEYGALSNSFKSSLQITILTDLMQQNFRSWTYWQFKYYNDITTMSNPGTTQSFYNADGSLQERKVKALARPYVYAVCGQPVSETLKNGILKFKWFADRKCFNKNTELYLSQAFYYPIGFQYNFSSTCKKCGLKLLPGEQKDFYQIILDQQSFNRTIQIAIIPKK